MRHPLSLILLLIIAGCQRRPESAPSPAELRAGVVGRAWEVTMIGGLNASAAAPETPRGASGLPATLRFDATEPIVTGFTGCSDFRASYRLAADSLRFTDAAVGSVDCDDGRHLDAIMRTVLAHTRRAELRAGHLVLLADDGRPIAHLSERSK
ncbi:MAG TPA: META domain-containing protein [Gemmatimonadaceae bacterium]|nr:META domain-containing protein [Gemmatimonadaceae bacterium]